MSSDASSSTSAADKPTKLYNRKQHKQDEQKRHRSVFEVSKDFFDSCLLLQSPFSSLPDSDVSGLSIRSLEGVGGELQSEDEFINNDFIGVSNGESGNNSNSKVMQKWSCNTCNAEFESLQDQRFHFKSDLHRFNIKLSIAGKNAIKEEDFDEKTSDSLFKDYDISSISGSEDDRENGILDTRQHGHGGILKSKIFIQLQTGERVSVLKCLVLNESENISFENHKSLGMDGGGDVFHLTHKEVSEKLKYIAHEPRDNSHLRIVLLARGGHFAGCVLDGNSLVAHKTFHRYVVRAKAGKKQSSKDASGRSIHSAGASLRRYNELALKKDIQELLTSWKPHFTVASCIFIYAPSNNRQLFFDGEKPYFISRHGAIRNIPLTIRRPTFKEARRVYGLLTQISCEISGETALNTAEDLLSGVNIGNDSHTEFSKMELTKDLEGTEVPEACSVVNKIDCFISLETKEEIDIFGTSTPLHEAAKSGNAQKVLELLEHGLDPCIKDERGQMPYMLANEKEVRNTFRRFMALNLEKWDWQAAHVPSALTKEMEESQAAKQAEKDAKRKAKAKELKKQRKAREKKAQAEAAQSKHSSVVPRNSGSGPVPAHNDLCQSSGSATVSKEEEHKRMQDAEREKRAAAAERRLAAAAEAKKTPGTGSVTAPIGSDILCSCCNVSLAGKVPFHRYHYKYCSTSCMHVHREILEDG